MVSCLAESFPILGTREKPQSQNTTLRYDFKASDMLADR
jgi:hypothetical protein